MTPLYTAMATTKGAGRAGGTGRTSDGSVEVLFAMPAELGGPGGVGTNPEQLMALGYSSCFASALHFVAGRAGRKLDGVEVTVKVHMGRNAAGGFAFAFEVEAQVANLTQAEADQLVAEAHKVCPYSNAFRDGSPVSARGIGLAGGAAAQA